MRAPKLNLRNTLATVALTAIAALSSLGLFASAASAAQPFGTSKCTNSVYKPASIVLACADGKVRFRVDEWVYWRFGSAHANGVVEVPDCPPNVPLLGCTDYADHEAALNLFRARFCSTTGHRQFTRLLMVDKEASTPATRQFRLNFECQYLHDPDGERETSHGRCSTSGVLALGTLERNGVNCTTARVLVLAFMSAANERGVAHADVKGFRCSNVGFRLRPGIICRMGERWARFLGAPNARLMRSLNTCAGDFRGDCLVRPHRLFTGAHTFLRGIHWVRWGRTSALGFGKLVERSLYASFVLPAEVRLGLPAECEGRQWFWSTTVRFGKGLHRPYLHDDNLTPCH